MIADAVGRYIDQPQQGANPPGFNDPILLFLKLVIDPDEETAEFGVAVTDRWQGHGIGGKLLDLTIEVARDFRLRRIWGVVLTDNQKMLGLCESSGFAIEHAKEPEMMYVTLDV